MASGESELTGKIASFHADVSALITLALRGSSSDAPPEVREEQIAFTLQQVWFASLVGWSAGLHETDTIVERVHTAAALMLDNGATP